MKKIVALLIGLFLMATTSHAQFEAKVDLSKNTDSSRKEAQVVYPILLDETSEVLLQLQAAVFSEAELEFFAAIEEYYEETFEQPIDLLFMKRPAQVIVVNTQGETMQEFTAFCEESEQHKLMPGALFFMEEGNIRFYIVDCDR